MTEKSQKITLALTFDKGTFIEVNGSNLYFIPSEGGDKAYMCQGSRSELMGKVHRELQTQSTDSSIFPPSRTNRKSTYDLTYEVEDGELISARLIAPGIKTKGNLADPMLVQVLEDDLENGRLTLVRKENPPAISRLAKFNDGELLILVSGLDKDSRHTLLKGTPGNFEKIEITNGIQGGNSLYYKTLDGKRVDFPYSLSGPKRSEPPIFDDRVLEYVTDYDAHDLDTFGIAYAKPEPHLDPFYRPDLSISAKPRLRPTLKGPFNS